MTAEIEERVDRVERLIDALESRLDMTGMHLQIVSDRRDPRPPGDMAGQQAEPAGEDVNLAQIDARLRSVALHQGGHSSDLRRIMRNLELLVGRKNRGE